MGASGHDLRLDEVGYGMTKQQYAGYRYIGLKPYIFVIKGEVHTLNTGDCLEILPEKLKTQRFKKLLQVIYK